jgi:hypothetical protein
VLVEPGWLQVYGKEISGEDANLVPVQKDEKVDVEKVAAHGLVTKPPARYNEASLLSAMEGAGKLVEDEELREAMAAKGLGTPATRAAIIEGLLGEKYMVREGRELIPTAKAFQLMTLLRGLGVEELTAPDANHRQAREGVRLRHDPRRLRDARNAVSELRRPGEGKLPPLRVQQVRVLDFEDSGRTPVRDSGSRGIAEGKDDRAAVGISQQDGPSVFGDPQALLRR